MNSKKNTVSDSKTVFQQQPSIQWHASCLYNKYYHCLSFKYIKYNPANFWGRRLLIYGKSFDYVPFRQQVSLKIKSTGEVLRETSLIKEKLVALTGTASAKKLQFRNASDTPILHAWLMQ